MNLRKLLRCFLMFSFGIIGYCHPSFADTKKSTGLMDESDKWHFIIAPYGWLSSISADISVKEITNHIFIPVTKILKHLDFIGELHLEANHGPWTFMLDPTFLKVSTNISAGPIYVGPLKRTVIGPVDVSITSQTLLIDGGVFYRVNETQTAPNQSLSL